MPSLEVNQLLRIAVDACDSRKAEDIRILALDPSESSLTDYFLICSGTNERQNVAISDEIEYRLKNEFGTLPNSVEGRRQGEWVLMDYVDFVVHIFMPEKRAYYGLEQLRKSATSLSIDELDDEIKAAVKAARQKGPAKRQEALPDAKEVATDEPQPAATKSATKTATKKSSPSRLKVPVKTAKKSVQAKKSAAKAVKKPAKRSTKKPAA